MLQKAVFVDKDGTLVEDIPYNVAPDRIVLSPRAIEACLLLERHGFELFVISNQSGVARGFFPLEALSGVETRLRDLLGRHGVRLAGFYYCPHHPEGTVEQFRTVCGCRKPAPGLILKAAEDHQLDLQRSWFIGDILDDVEAGNRAGCRSILVDRGGETEWRFTTWRQPARVVHDLYAAATWIISAPAVPSELASAPA